MEKIKKTLTKSDRSTLLAVRSNDDNATFSLNSDKVQVNVCYKKCRRESTFIFSRQSFYIYLNLEMKADLQSLRKNLFWPQDGCPAQSLVLVRLFSDNQGKIKVDRKT